MLTFTDEEVKGQIQEEVGIKPEFALEVLPTDASGVAPWLRPVPKMLRLADFALYGVGSVR
jgi:hypothetical protein